MTSSLRLSFPAAVVEEFWLALGVPGGYNGVSAQGAASARGHDGRKDPRALVGMAYALVLVVLVVALFPEHGEEVCVGEDVYGVLGIGLTELDSGMGFDSGGNKGGLEPDYDSGDGYCTSGEFKHCVPHNHPANTSSPTWWIAGVGEREIVEIARHLDALDEGERFANRMEPRIVEGRWMK